MVTCGFDRSVRIWDADSGHEDVCWKQGHSNQVSCAAFSPDGTKVASGSWDRTILIRDISTVHVELTIKGQGVINNLAFSPDGLRLAVSIDSEEVNAKIYQIGI